MSVCWIMGFKYIQEHMGTSKYNNMLTDLIAEHTNKFMLLETRSHHANYSHELLWGCLNSTVVKDWKVAKVRFTELVVVTLGTYPTRGVHSLKMEGILAALVKIVYCMGYVHRQMYTMYTCVHLTTRLITIKSRLFRGRAFTLQHRNIQ